VPETAGFRVGLRQNGHGDTGASVGVTAVLDNGERYVDLGYPGADDRPDRGHVKADIQTSDNGVSLVMNTKTLPDWAPLGDFEWEASSLGIGNRPGLQYMDCAPTGGEHVAYPSGRLVQFSNGRGGC